MNIFSPILHICFIIIVPLLSPGCVPSNCYCFGMYTPDIYSFLLLCLAILLSCLVFYMDFIIYLFQCLMLVKSPRTPDSLIHWPLLLCSFPHIVLLFPWPMFHLWLLLLELLLTFSSWLHQMQFLNPWRTYFTFIIPYFLFYCVIERVHIIYCTSFFSKTWLCSLLWCSKSLFRWLVFHVEF